MLLASDGIAIGENLTTVLPSKIDVDFFLQCSANITETIWLKVGMDSDSYLTAELQHRDFCVMV